MWSCFFKNEYSWWLQFQIIFFDIENFSYSWLSVHNHIKEIYSVLCTYIELKVLHVKIRWWTWTWISKRRFAGTKHCGKCDECFIQITELICVIYSEVVYDTYVVRLTGLQRDGGSICRSSMTLFLILPSLNWQELHLLSQFICSVLMCFIGYIPSLNCGLETITCVHHNAVREECSLKCICNIVTCLQK